MYSPFVVFSKSDRKGKAEKETDKFICYSGLLYKDKYDPTKLAKEVEFGEFWSKQDIDFKPNTEYMAEITYYSSKKRIVNVMTKEEFIKMFQ